MSDNLDSRSTVIRVVHNRENPFVQLNKKALWDSNLSLKALGLWSRCMSRPDNWKFSIKELTKSCKEGRRAIDSAMKELIAEGYAVRLEYSQKDEHGKFMQGMCGIEYVFFEFPATEEEKQEQLEIFKKSFLHCGFGDRRNGDSRNAHLLIKIATTNTDPKEKETPPIPPHPDFSHFQPKEAEASKPAKAGEKKSSFSQEVKETGDKIIQVMKEAKPDYAAPRNMHPLYQHVDFMMRMDNRSPQKIIDIIKWALADDFWSSHMYKPNPAKYLRDKFDQLCMKMNSTKKGPERKFAPSSDDAAALAKMQEMRKRAL